MIETSAQIMAYDRPGSYNDLYNSLKDRQPQRQKHDAFVFSSGSIGELVSSTELPMYWRLSNANYNCNDDDAIAGDGDDFPHVDDVAMDLFIERILLSATMKKEENDVFGISKLI